MAAFAKRLCRLALTAPPSGALFICALVFNLLRRHPSLAPLIHRAQAAVPTLQDYTAAAAVLVTANSAASITTGLEKTSKRAKHAAVISAQSIAPPIMEKLPGADPFDALTNDPAAANALESSLWELKVIRSTY